MYADQYGTPTQQHLWHIDYKRPSERDTSRVKRCENCLFLGVVRPGEVNKKLICQFGPTLKVQASAICKNWKAK